MDSAATRETMGIHDAFLRGDLAGLRSALGDPDDFPNTPLPLALGDRCLGYAIAHSPLPLVRALLECGADPNHADTGGFPSLLAALATDRNDRYAIVRLLLEHGTDVGQRGINDYTPLHFAAALDDASAVELLLAAGADPNARTRIDEQATALEEALHLGRTSAASALQRAHADGRDDPTPRRGG
jgi:ankyrin repeat protein